jgi:hypothetical protein
MSGIILSTNPNPYREQFESMHVRITQLSEQVNYLLRCLYRESNGNHEVFKRNQHLQIETKKAVELEQERKREVKRVEDTPDYTREKLLELKAKMETNNL